MNIRFNDMKFCCLDCESTGLDTKTDRIIEIAIVTFVLSSTGYEVKDTFNTLINPTQKIPIDSISIHHITDEMVSNKPIFSTFSNKIKEIVNDHPIIGHSIHFDLSLIKNELQRMNQPYPFKKNTVIDTLRLSRLNGSDIDNSLIKVAKKNNIKAIQTHRALDDVMLNIEVFNILSKKYSTFDQMSSALLKPIKLNTLPFGKYKGRSLSDIPEKHLYWLSKQDFDQDITHTLKKEIKRRKQNSGFDLKNNPFSNFFK